VDAIAWLDPPLLLSKGIAGYSYEVTIGGRAIILTLPSQGPEHFGESREARTAPIPKFPPPKLAEALVSGVRAHSSVSRPTPDPALVVAAVRLRWPDGDLKQLSAMHAPSDLAAQLGAWLSRVRDWLAAWSGNLRETVFLEPTPAMRLGQFGGPQKGPIGAGGSNAPVMMLGERTSDSVEVRAAFVAASRDEGLPLPRLLLAEAQVHAVRQHYRQAVISACGAVEVALSESARTAFSRVGRSKKEIDSVLRGVSGVVELYRLNAGRKDGLAVSIAQVIDQLAGPRNRAAHEGEALDKDTGRKAIRTARALLEVSPLRTPRSFLRHS
jgi:hypothetical protein